MKIIKSFILFLCTAALPCAMLFLFFDEELFILLLCVYLFVWSLIFVFIDKFILMTLEAREVIETDEHELFQSIKNLSYITYNKEPRVYLYSGHVPNIFIFEARNEWAIVIDRNFLKIVRDEQVYDFVKMVFELKDSNIPWVQTKVLGIILFFKASIYWIFQVFLNREKLQHIYRALIIFFIGMIKPFTYPLELIVSNQKSIVLSDNLKPLLNQIEEKGENHSEHLLAHLVEEANSRSWLISYMESHTVLKNCRFSKDEY